MLINRLILSTQSVARVNPPKYRIDIDFALDRESTIEVLSKCKTQSEVNSLQDAIENAVCLAICKMDKKELENKPITEYLRLTIDLTNKNRLFGLLFKSSGDNRFIVTKVKIISSIEENKPMVGFHNRIFQ